MKRIHFSIVLLAFILIAGCVPAKKVSLIRHDGKIFVGTLNYDGPYSGSVTIENGPNNEKFKGRYVVVDKTATKKSQGTLVNQGPSSVTIGASSGNSSSKVDASGYWYATGSRGSHMKCILTIGVGGHGHGVCDHENGEVYDIML
ncbi:MAG: hypothetical protein JBO36_15500 [Candidatus Thiodiazotropha taylori]|nr:hypothetical protein [Candidatus Thiodiazotropha taylori]